MDMKLKILLAIRIKILKWGKKSKHKWSLTVYFNRLRILYHVFGGNLQSETTLDSCFIFKSLGGNLSGYLFKAN